MGVNIELYIKKKETTKLNEQTGKNYSKKIPRLD